MSKDAHRVHHARVGGAPLALPVYPVSLPSRVPLSEPVSPISATPRTRTPPQRAQRKASRPAGAMFSGFSASTPQSVRTGQRPLAVGNMSRIVPVVPLRCAWAALLTPEIRTVVPPSQRAGRRLDLRRETAMSQRKAHNLRTRSGRRARHVERVRELASRLHRPMAGGAIPQRPVVAPQRLRHDAVPPRVEQRDGGEMRRTSDARRVQRRHRGPVLLQRVVHAQLAAGDRVGQRVHLRLSTRCTVKRRCSQQEPASVHLCLAQHAQLDGALA